MYRLTSEDTLESANSSLALKVKNYQKFGKLRFFMFLKKVSSAHQGYIYWIKKL